MMLVTKTNLLVWTAILFDSLVFRGFLKKEWRDAALISISTGIALFLSWLIITRGTNH